MIRLATARDRLDVVRLLEADSFTLFRRIRSDSTSSDHEGSVFVSAMICRSGKTVSLLFFIFYFSARSGRARRGGFGVRRGPFLGGKLRVISLKMAFPLGGC